MAPTYGCLSVVSVVNGMGGSGLSGLEVSYALACRGHKVTVLTYPGSIAHGQLEHPNLEFRVVEPMFIDSLPHPSVVLSFASAIRDLADSAPVDIVHAHYAATHGEAALLGRDAIASDLRAGSIAMQSRLPATVISCRGTDISRFALDVRTRAGLRHVLSRADAVTFVSRDLQKRAVSALGLHDPGFVIPNFVPRLGDSTKSFRTSVNLPPKATVFFHVSVFREIKNVCWIIEAFARVTAVIPETHLLLVGDGPTFARAEQLAADRELVGRVTFTGWVTPELVRPTIQQADVLVMASDLEGCPRAVLEAMAEGKPVIATDVGGLNELVVHAQTGLLTPAGELDAYAAAMVSMAQDPEFRVTLGGCGRELALRRHDVDAVATQYEHVYEAAIAMTNIR